MEDELRVKKGDYDLSGIDMTELKRYLIETQSDILSGNLEKANITLTAAYTEYDDLIDNIKNAPKRPFLQKIKDNIIPISAISGTLITLFSLYEILKKKKEHLYQKIKEVKVNENTKIIVKQRKRKTQGQL